MTETPRPRRPDWTGPSPWREFREVQPWTGAPSSGRPVEADERPVVVGISGASGAVLARATVRRLVSRGERLEIVTSRAAHEVWEDELGEPLDAGLRAIVDERSTVYPSDRFNVPPASGSHRTRGMVVVPCSMTTVGGLAAGAGDDLLKRCADVCIKEGRRLVLVPRESPLSAIHLRNLAALAELGVRIVPPIPPFYRRPTSLDEAVEQVVDRVMQAFYD